MPTQHGSTPSPSDPGSFSWPPRGREPGESEPAPSPPRENRNARVTTPRPPPTFWSAVERTCLDIASAPLPQRMADANWAPDEFADYCGRCGRAAKAGAIDLDGCADCRGIRLAWSRMVRLGEFAGPLRTWVHEVKYTRWRRLGHDLGVMLGERLLEAHAMFARGTSERPPFLVPVPDAGLRRLARGIDHAMVICRGVQAATGWDFIQPLRRRLGPSQVSVAPSQRAANVAKSFALRSGFDARRLDGRLVVLVDDVCTTGATMRACARAVSMAARQAAHGAVPGVWVAVLGRTEPPKEGGSAAQKGSRNGKTA